MDRNFLLAMSLSLAVVVVWTMYTEGKRRQELAEHPPVAEAPAAETAAPPRFPESRGMAPEQTGATSDLDVPRGTPREPAAEALQSEGPEIRTVVRTPLFDAELTSRGGGLLRWDLLRYDDASRPGRPPVSITTLAPGEIALSTPLTGLGLGDLSQASYRLSEPDALTRNFTLQHKGVRVRKSYRFRQDDYSVRLRIEVENHSDRHLQPGFELQWPARAQESVDFRDFSVGVYQEGDVELLPIRSSRSFFGLGGGGITEVHRYGGPIDWAAANTTYFLAAITPDRPQQAQTVVEPIAGEAARVAIRLEPVQLPPGQRLDAEYRLYLGPKEQERLGAFGAHLDEAIPKGWFPSLTRFFTWLLDAAYSVIPNYGVAIILITIVVRLLMAPLMARQMKSMKRMSDIAPLMKEIQEKYKDDRERQSREMMALYQREGVSPFSMVSGCLPMLLQFPVFIGFYYALQSAIHLRQQPFIGWIDDLSRPEQLFVLPGLDLPVRVLPILMGASMFLQQRLTPSGTMDPAQQRMMMTVMPVMFTVLFYQFASGLVLYWFFSTLIGIGQQMWTNRAKTKPVAS